MGQHRRRLQTHNIHKKQAATKASGNLHPPLFLLHCLEKNSQWEDKLTEEKSVGNIIGFVKITIIYIGVSS